MSTHRYIDLGTEILHIAVSDKLLCLGRDVSDLPGTANDGAKKVCANCDGNLRKQGKSLRLVRKGTKPNKGVFRPTHSFKDFEKE